MDANTAVELTLMPTHCGLIMPLAEFDNCPVSHWDEVRGIITSAVEDIPSPKFRARMVSEGDETGIIHRRIIQNVYADPIVVCDLSGRNPNVLFELGMRLAFDKPVVLIKDDKTPFMFDTGMIEHLPYPRDLRHGAIELFKTSLAKKVANTYAASNDNPDAVSFIKSFGPFKTVSIDEVKEPADKAILSMLGDMRSQINRLANSMQPRAKPPPSPPSSEVPDIARIHSLVLNEITFDRQASEEEIKLRVETKLGKPLSIIEHAMVNSSIEGVWRILGREGKAES